MTTPNVGLREQFVRLYAAILLVAIGIVLPLVVEPLMAGVGMVATFAAAYLMYKSAMNRYCPVHERLGVDTTDGGRD